MHDLYVFRLATPEMSRSVLFVGLLMNAAFSRHHRQSDHLALQQGDLFSLCHVDLLELMLLKSFFVDSIINMMQAMLDGFCTQRLALIRFMATELETLDSRRMIGEEGPSLPVVS